MTGGGTLSFSLFDEIRKQMKITQEENYFGGAWKIKEMERVLHCTELFFMFINKTLKNLLSFP